MELINSFLIYHRCNVKETNLFNRLPFSMPSCEGISLDRIVDIQRFRPFMVKGVTKPPFVFPEVNYPEWLRMMARLRNHVSSKTREVSDQSYPFIEFRNFNLAISAPSYQHLN